MYTQEIIKFLKTHFILNSIWLILLLIILYTFINDWLYKYNRISHNEAIFLINKKNAIIIDVRNHNDYLLGHIINSINISIEKIKNNNFLKLKKFKKEPLIIVNYNSSLSNDVIQHFNQLGFEKVYVLHGGINHWKANNLPLLLKNNHK